MTRSRMLVALGMLAGSWLAGCGATGAPSGTATGAGTPSADQSNLGLEISRCMRAHGITNFPDPSSRGGIELARGSGLDPQSPAFQAARTACKRYLPDKGLPPVTSAADRAKALAFARCMRSHGEPDFPDALLSLSRGAVRVLALHGMSFAIGAGIDPRSPAFQQAAKACGVDLPGFGQAR